MFPGGIKRGSRTLAHGSPGPGIVPHRAGWALAIALWPSIGLFLGGFDSLIGQDVIGIGYGAMLVVAVYALAPSPRFWRRTWPVMALMVAAWAWIAAVSLGWWGSHHLAPDIAPPGLIGFAGLIAALLCGALIGYRGVQSARIADWLLFFGTLSLLWALTMGSDAAPLPAIGMDEDRFLGTLSNANASAAIFVGLAGLTLARLLQHGPQPWAHRSAASGFRTVAYWIVILLMLCATLLTGSRSGTVIGLLVLSLILLRGVQSRVSLRVAGPILGAIVLVAAVLFSSIVLQRFQVLPNEILVRLLIWKHSWALVTQSPLTGYGINGFSMASAGGTTDALAAQALWTVNSPHNIVLRLLIDGGWPYLLLTTAALLAIAVPIIRAAWGRRLDIMDWGFIGAVGAAIASSQIDIALEFPAIAAATMSWIGLLWGRAIRNRPPIGI